MSRESPAPDKVLMSVVQRIGIVPGWISSASRSALRRSDCSFESAGAANAAESACNGSTCVLAMLADRKHNAEGGQQRTFRSLNLSSLLPLYYGLQRSAPGLLIQSDRRMTQAAQHSQGIQTLLEAEKEAAKIVQQARQCLYRRPSQHLAPRLI